MDNLQTKDYTFDVIGLRKRAAHKTHQSSRKANKLLRKESARLKEHRIGDVYNVVTKVGLVPYNRRGFTDYLLPADTTCIAERVERWNEVWYMLYHTKGQLFDSIEDVKQHVKGIRCNRGEFKIVDKSVVFRATDKVALRKMLPENWADDPSHLARVQAVFVK